MGVPVWGDDPAAWDRIEINGFEFDETKVDIDGDFGNDFDIKKAPGADGATLTNKGVEPIKPSAKWLLYTSDHWDTYQALIAAVYPYPGKTPLPLLEVIHPQLQLLKKAKFRLQRVHTLKVVGKQILEARFDLVEYFDTPKKVPSPSPTVVASRERERDFVLLEEFKPSKNAKP